MNRITRTLALTGAIAVVAAPVAYGHAEVTKYSPKRGSTVSRSLSTVSATFSEAVLGGKLVVRDAKGVKYSKSSSLVKGKTTLRATLKSLHKGRYTAKASWVADDGDKQTKRWSFTVR
jgi:methionine-rich copper-binding protein CopC